MRFEMSWSRCSGFFSYSGARLAARIRLILQHVGVAHSFCYRDEVLRKGRRRDW
uniref:Uncharacterized protein n=1 Tax=Sphingomonas sp. JE1 TaxID=1628059 RepID=A0A0D4ZYW5_9SPHN|nr:hypothetical protein pJE1_045 [Sphingomonas sp. JE1]